MFANAHYDGNNYLQTAEFRDSAKGIRLASINNSRPSGAKIIGTIRLSRNRAQLKSKINYESKWATLAFEIK